MIDQFAREGSEIALTIVAGDLDGDALLYSVAAGLPEGAQIAADTGLFFWTPGFDQAGDYTITLAAQDGSGSYDTTDVVVHVSNTNRSPMLSTSDHTVLLGRATSFFVNASDADAGAVLTFNGIDLPAGAMVDEDTGEFKWTPGPGQGGDYLVTFEVTDGAARVQETIVLRAVTTPAPPVVHVELTPSFPALPNQAVLVHAIAQSLGTIESLTLTLDGQPVTLDAQGRATLRIGQPGKYELVATAIDSDGIVGTTTKHLKVRDPADKSAPIVVLGAAIQSAALSSAMTVAGSVSDVNLDSWTLQLAPKGSFQFQTLAGGDEPVNGSLATIDPSQLRNGFYTLKLSARDIGRRRTEVTTLIEINTATKAAAYTRGETDLSIDLGGGALLTIARHYSSLDGDVSGLFGGGWSLLNREVRLESNVAATGRENLGVYNAFSTDTRVYLTLPTGERAGFTFTPIAEVIAGRTFYRPAWTADGTHGYMLGSVDAQLVKSGASYFDATTGQPYSPANPAFEGADYSLTAPDGTRFLIDSQRGITEQELPGGARLFISDSGIVASTGPSVQFIRDAAGRLSSVAASTGVTVTYVYDDAGNLAAVRNLGTGQGARYGYEGNDAGRLITVVNPSGTGDAVVYPNGMVPIVTAIRADLGGASKFTGVTNAGVLTEGTSHLYALSVRESELRSTATGRVILRVELSPAAGSAFVAGTPTIVGQTPLSVKQLGDRIVALFAMEEEGLYQLGVSGTGSGAYELRVSAAGDLDVNGVIDGADSALVSTGQAQYDIDGDGANDLTDTQVVIANYGFLRNGAPQLNPALLPVLTHVDLGVGINLAQVASDPDGDAVYYRIVAANHGTAALSASGQSLMFMPESGFSGLAEVMLIADDGFNTAPVATVQVNVSSAPLLSLDFNQRVLQLADGESVTIQVIGQFADQADVVLPMAFVNAHLVDPTVATLSSTGLLSGATGGATALVAEHAGVRAATAVAVGVPTDDRQFSAYFLGIDAYPNSTTLSTTGQRQIVVSVGGTQELFVTGDAAVKYFVASDGVVMVNAGGLIEAVAEGETSITVIYGGSEETIQIKVEAPKQGVVTVDKAGAIVEGPQGYQVAIGPDQLTGAALVSIDPIAAGDLPLPVPNLFNYAAAFELNVDGAELTGPVQVAAPVDPGVASPGDQVWFYQVMQFPDENGVLHDYWTVMDVGTVDNDGMARTTSPPFPGLSRRGSILIAKAAQPTGILRLDSGFANRLQWAFVAGIGVATTFAATGGLLGAAGGVAIAGAFLAIAILPAIYDRMDIAIWRMYGKKPASVEMTVTPPEGAELIRLTARVPEAPTDSPAPAIDEDGVDYTVDDAGKVTLSITGTQFFNPDEGQSLNDAQVVFLMRDRRVVVTGDKFTSTSPSGDGGTIELEVPDEVLLGMSKVIVERPQTVTTATGEEETSFVASQQATVKNKGGYGFVGKVIQNNEPLGIEVIDINNDAIYASEPSPDPQKLERVVKLADHIYFNSPEQIGRASCRERV